MFWAPAFKYLYNCGNRCIFTDTIDALIFSLLFLLLSSIFGQSVIEYYKSKIQQVIDLRNAKAYDDLLRFFPQDGVGRVVRCALQTANGQVDEIRLRTERPLSFVSGSNVCYIDRDGEYIGTSDLKNAYVISKQELAGIYRAVCENSVYAYLDDIRKGFVTVRGGHRIGFAGRAICGDSGRIENFRDINSINIRIAREVKDCAKNIISRIYCGNRVKSTLIISPPSGGKTTVLRDITRSLSCSGIKVGVADDRGEISAMYHGVPQNDIGINTDVVENAEKSDGIEILQRTMSPSVIVTDEIVTAREVEAICKASGTGISIIASIHGYEFNEVLSKPVCEPLFKNNVFELLVRITGRSETGPEMEVRAL